MTDPAVIEHPEKLKVVELKEELEKRGLDTKGLKKDLVARLEQAQSEQKETPVEDEPIVEQSAANDDANDEEKNTQNTTKDEEEGAGHTMVEGSPEKAAEIRQLESEAIEMELKGVESTEPAVLDEDVATIVAKEEVKMGVPPSPEPIRAISPLPPSGKASPNQMNNEEMVVDPPSTDTQPAVLDEEVAKDVVVEEKKEMEEIQQQDQEDITENEVNNTRISPLPPSRDRSPSKQAQSPPMANTSLPDDDVMDLDDGDEDDTIKPPSDNKKRSLDEENIPAPKRPRARETVPLPLSLSHLLHPPTSTLYITNLRRPLLHPALHEYLYDNISPISDPRLPDPKMPFATEEQPGLWLSGIKSHAYATFPSVREAVLTAERIEGQKWPEETGDKLHVEFVDDDLVRDLVEREEVAWKNGRQKLNLTIRKDDNGEVKFEFQGAGALGRIASRNDTRSGPSPANSINIRGGGGGGGGRQFGIGPPHLSGANSVGPRSGLNGSGRGMVGSSSNSSGLASRPETTSSGNGRRISGDIGRSTNSIPHMNPERARLNGFQTDDRSRHMNGQNRERQSWAERQRDDRSSRFSNNRENEIQRRPGGSDSWRAGDPLGGEKRGMGMIEKRTSTRPGLLWAEGPGARR